MPTANINKAKLYYQDTGKGTDTIVFGHGLLFSCRMFDAQVAALKDRYRCIAFDFRGQGQSEVSENRYDMDTLFDDVSSLIEDLGCSPCHYLGFSMGGFVGLRLASRRPDLLKSLILVDTAADAEPKENMPKYRMLNFIARWFGFRLVVNQVMPIMFAEPFMSDPNRADLRDEWKQQLLSNHKIGATKAVKGVINRSSMQGELSKIDLPTLILVGEMDTATVPERSKQMHEAIAGSKMVVVPNAGHMTPVEEPKAVNSAIDEFISSFHDLAS